MNPWDLASALAILTASVPPLYFAVRLRSTSPTQRALVLLLAAAFLVHGAFHLTAAVSLPEDAVIGAETLSAVLILAYAVAYWHLRGGGSP